MLRELLLMKYLSGFRVAHMKKLLYLLILLFPMQLVMAQSATETAELALAVEIANQLNSDNDPNNNVSVPGNLDEAAAVIAAAPAAIVTAAISTVTTGASPEVATEVASFAAINNSNVSTADAASAASVSEAAVTAVATGVLTQLVTAAITAGTLVNSAGGVPSVPDIIAGILNDPDMNITEVLPGTSQQVVLDAIVAYVADNPDLLSDDQLAALGTITSGP